MENSLLDSGETMEIVTTQKIEETVKSILSESDMDQMTEFKLRLDASAKLGIDLSGTNHKKLVRDVLEVFLLSTPGEALVPETVAPAKNETVSVAATSVGGEDERFICKVATLPICSMFDSLYRVEIVIILILSFSVVTVEIVGL